MSQTYSDVLSAELEHEVARRRTFAIISHPDAGKTTLTEKLLLYAGAVDVAGAVRARRSQRHATSDWMEMEQQRGISITSTALQFEYDGHRLNLLDTPGHQDFSEDTYRTLTAVDSVVMILDAAKGIEPQTLKLFEVCRLRRIPILTFINKMDLPSREPLALLDEIEDTLGIAAAPLNWPIGSGSRFRGVYDFERQQVLRFERTVGGQFRAPVHVSSLEDTRLRELLGENLYRELREEAELVALAGATFDEQQFRQGELTPLHFGSAINNFGIEVFLENLLRLAPPPQPRMSDYGAVEPTTEDFTGFVFKVQANMDPRHRDQMAFVRVCSGHFEKGMLAQNSRTGQSLRLNRIHRLFAQEREIVEEAFPGDVVGLTNTGLRLGDTLSAGPPLQFEPIPSFQPERFGLLRNLDLTKSKQFRKGLQQLENEGVIQVLYAQDAMRREPILAAVGDLQFDVVQARLEGEYGVQTAVTPLPHSQARWVAGDRDQLEAVRWPSRSIQTTDRDGCLVVLFESAYEIHHVTDNYPEVQLSTLGT